MAPHPDDESLACSIILQRALARGASVRVVYATRGDNNPWPQRAILRKWRLTDIDRAAWGKLREQEALKALNLLGLPHCSVEFLGLPDQGLTSLLLSGCEQSLSRLRKCMAEWNPTDILCPDISDVHPDHSALGLIIRSMVAAVPASADPATTWNFLVHGDWMPFSRRATALEQTPDETALKIAAISCHKTQLTLSRKRFMAYANRPEYFALGESEYTQSSLVAGPPPQGCDLIVNIRRPIRRRAAPDFLIFGRDRFGQLLSARLAPDPLRAIYRVLDFVTNECIAIAEIEEDRSSDLRVAIPDGLFSAESAVYMKVNRRGLFFDKSGWMEACRCPDPMPAATIEASEFSFAVT